MTSETASPREAPGAYPISSTSSSKFVHELAQTLRQPLRRTLRGARLISPGFVLDGTRKTPPLISPFACGVVVGGLANVASSPELVVQRRRRFVARQAEQDVDAPPAAPMRHGCSDASAPGSNPPANA